MFDRLDRQGDRERKKEKVLQGLPELYLITHPVSPTQPNLPDKGTRERRKEQREEMIRRSIEQTHQTKPNKKEQTKVPRQT
mmetsp:Transcript_50989/g.100238  ORF Transcript_50989/g.100238 Transcript_50989/m.100238 type:complete len:81 (-) Transcript_50989:896-1138(-)